MRVLHLRFLKIYSGHATYEENNLLKRELERLKIESSTINSSTNDQLIKLRNEIEELKIKLKLETDARKAAQKLAKELQLKNDKLRLRGAKKGKFDGKELEEIQVRYQLPVENSKPEVRFLVIKQYVFFFRNDIIRKHVKNSKKNWPKFHNF